MSRKFRKDRRICDARSTGRYRPQSPFWQDVTTSYTLGLLLTASTKISRTMIIHLSQGHETGLPGQHPVSGWQVTTPVGDPWRAFRAWSGAIDLGHWPVLAFLEVLFDRRRPAFNGLHESYFREGSPCSSHEPRDPMAAAYTDRQSRPCAWCFWWPRHHIGSICVNAEFSALDKMEGLLAESGRVPGHSPATDPPVR